MRRIAVIAAVSCLLLASSGRAQQPAPEPLPSWTQYHAPQEIARLKQAVRSGNEAVVREHGWKLFAGIEQPAKHDPSWPIWYTWPNTKAAFTIKAIGSAQGTGATGVTGMSLIQHDVANGINQLAALPQANRAAAAVPVNVAKLPIYPIPEPVKQAYPQATSDCATQQNPNNICDGAHFLFNGDIMIPTESLSPAAYRDIRDGVPPRKLPLNEQSSLNALRAGHVGDIDLSSYYVVTKHMFWPVLKASVQRYSAIPVWHVRPLNPNDPRYAGYETWGSKNLIAVDPTNMASGSAKVQYLYGVQEPDGKRPWPTISGVAPIYKINDFYYHRVTESDWKSFDQADKAILNAASYWAYDKPFGPGDYLVTIAMHINTFEIPTWALQSVWWSPHPNASSYARNRPDLASVDKTSGVWRHYLLVDAYGIPDKHAPTRQPIAMNPYIELAIHPVGTNCNNCHVRAGWPTGNTKASYQNPACPDLLATAQSLENTGCFKGLTRTGFQWIIPDRAVAPPKP